MGIRVTLGQSYPACLSGQVKYKVSYLFLFLSTEFEWTNVFSSDFARSTFQYFFFFIETYIDHVGLMMWNNCSIQL